jgi:hypothetical protein
VVSFAVNSNSTVLRMLSISIATGNLASLTMDTAALVRATAVYRV